MKRGNGLLFLLATIPLSFAACAPDDPLNEGETAGALSLALDTVDKPVGSGRQATSEEVAHLLSLPVAQADGHLRLEDVNAQVPPSPKSPGSSLPVCNIRFNAPDALKLLVDHGYSTFITSPWYAESCDNGAHWIRGKGVNIDHWHLVAEAANQCYGTSPKWGTTSGSSCINQTDAKYWPRTAANMNGDSGISFKAETSSGNSRNLDLKAIYVRDGSIKVLANRVGVGWWVWHNLSATGRWYWTVNNLKLSDVRVFDTHESGVFAIDNLEVAIYP